MASAEELAAFRAEIAAQRTPLPRPPERKDLVVAEEELLWPVPRTT